jgi:hypothetical protein
MVLCGRMASASQPCLDQPQVVIEMLDEVGISRVILESARATVAEIYDAIGVTVVWVDRYPNDRSVLVVRIVTEEAAERLNAPPASVGISPRDAERNGRMAYVFYERVRNLSDRQGLGAPKMLGAAVAHELGHLLLPYSGHSKSGLMRAHWTRGDLLNADGPGLRFTAEQGALIRAKLDEWVR